MIRRLFFLLVVVWAAGNAAAQDLPALRHDIDTLCTPYFAGRGYVENGMGKAADWLSVRFTQLGLRPFAGNYRQAYTFPVNTFPGDMSLQLDGKNILAGSGFLVAPGSRGITCKDRRIVITDLSKIRDEKAWIQRCAKMGKQEQVAYLLQHIDVLEQTTGKKRQQLLPSLESGVYLLPEKGLPLWSVATDTLAATVLQVYDSALLESMPRRLSAAISQRFEPHFPAVNIAGYVPGSEHPDSFIVITAHYDHLGKMGREALFPGASDNASGTAMLLALARFYAVHPGRYSIAFILFSGEEAGLLGSTFYVEHPLFPLERIRLLLNLDILGDASKGIVVVNGKGQPEAFQLLETLNRMDNEGSGTRTYVPGIKIRDNAPNSDHYPFSRKGVPAIFIYSEGGKGFYHNTFDVAASLSLEHIPALSSLLKQFIAALQ